MKIDILFRLTYLCLVIGSIKAVDDSEAPVQESNTTVPSVVNNSTEDLNNTSSNNTIVNEDKGETSNTTSTTLNPVPVETSSSPNATSSTTKSTKAPTAKPTVPSTASTESGETTQTTDLSTGENSPTAAPKTGSVGFNALSFIGGIVFTVGLLAIMYVGFKFYKSRTERNYHTL